MHMLPNSGVCPFLLCLKCFSKRTSSELKKGSKRVTWKNIKEQNTWYISDTFLIAGRTFENPTRLSETDLRKYWRHWYKLSQSGQSFTFKRTGIPNSDPEGSAEEHQSRQEENESKGGDPEEKEGSEEEPRPEAKGQPGESNEDQDAPYLTPSHCHSDQDKISFLRTLAPNNQSYQSIINILAQMKVRPLYCLTGIWLTVRNI